MPRAANPTTTVRRAFNLPARLWRSIAEYRAEEQLPTETEALRVLLTDALAVWRQRSSSEPAPEEIVYTYERRFAAWLSSEHVIVTIPDQVADDQMTWNNDGMAFPALRRDNTEIMVRLDGRAYGLGTPGTGDPVVVAAEE